jgi:hypothetical protein
MRNSSKLVRFGDFALLLAAWSLACAAFCFALSLDPSAVLAFCIVTFCALVLGLVLLVIRRPEFKAGTAHSREGTVTFIEILEQASHDSVPSRHVPGRALRLANRPALLLPVRGFGAPTAILITVLCAIFTAGVLPETANRFIAIFEIVALGVAVFGVTTLWFAFIAIVSRKRRLQWLAYLLSCWRAQL